MKTVRFLIILGLLATVFTNCKKDSNGFEGLRVTVDGTEWVAPVVTGIAQAGFLSVIGTDATGSKSLTILAPADIAAGTYDLATSVTISVSYNGGTSGYTPKSGQLVVTEHAGKRIKGTLEFEGEDLLGGGTASFTDGEFNVVYQ